MIDDIILFPSLLPIFLSSSITHFQSTPTPAPTVIPLLSIVMITPFLTGISSSSIFLVALYLVDLLSTPVPAPASAPAPILIPLVNILTLDPS